MKRAALMAVGLLGLSLAAHPVSAADFSFTGNFTQDDDVQAFSFTVGSASNVTLLTWSYAGGTNAAGDTIARGGFDPILALFDSTGALVGQNDDGTSSQVPADALTGANFDTFFQATLAAGTYLVTIMEYDNFANGPNFSNGFIRAGDGNFTAGNGCPDNLAAFNDVSGLAGCGRDSHWAFDLLNVNDAIVVGTPEPGTLALVGVGLAAFGIARRRRSA